MDMDQSAVFLAGSILTALGFMVVIGAVVVINNLLHKYWKPVSLFTPDSWKAMNPPGRFVNQEELQRVSPSFESEPIKTDKKIN